MTDYQTLVAEARAGTLALPDFADRPAATGSGLAIVAPAGPPAAKKPVRLVLPEHPEDYVWERLKGEPAFWYDRFERYLRMCYDGKTGRRVRARQLKATFRECAYAENPTGHQPVHPSPSWYSAYQRFRWRERAEAYDAWYDQQQRQALLNRVAQDREDRETNLKSVRGKLASRILAMDDQEVAKLPPQIVFQAMVAINRELRAEAEHALEVDGRVLEQEQEDEQLPFKAYGESGGSWVDEV